MALALTLVLGMLLQIPLAFGQSDTSQAPQYRPWSRAHYLAETDALHLFPDTYNYDPVGGRLFLQPLGMNDDRVVMGPAITMILGETSTYSPNFKDMANSNPALKSNAHIMNLQLSHGFRLKGYKLEVGGIIRNYQDEDQSNLSVFIAKVHEAVGSSPGAELAPYSGAVGENHTVVIGDDGSFFVSSADLYLKLQLLEEKPEGWLPNLAVKFIVRAPLSNQEFNKFGEGLAVGLSKHLTNRLIFVSSVAIAHQQVEGKDFDSENLIIEPWMYDVFGGLVYDLKSPGFWTVSGGLKRSSRNIYYQNNPASAEPANIMLFSVNYQTRLKEWSYSFQFSEDVANPRRAVEPDFTLEMTVRYRPKASKRH